MKRIPSTDAECSTLVELLRWRALNQPDQKAYAFLTSEEEEESLTYAELDRQARAIGATLQRRGATGERVLLLYPAGLAYIAAFFGCLYAGALAVPAYPPRANHAEERIASIAADAQARFVLTTNSLLPEIQRSLALLPDLQALQWMATDVGVREGQASSLQGCEKDEEWWQMPEVMGSTLAFLQYTSGSTTTPKGVMVSHSNLMSNHRMLQNAMAHPAGVPFVSWLPLFHDMGLTMYMLQALYVGSPCILLPSSAFIQSPFRWLSAISLYGAYSSGAPNFAYELCVQKITPEQRDRLDLSCWKFASCAAEPIRFQTLLKFAEYFAPCGFRLEALRPGYGLAEATVFVTTHQSGWPPVAHLLKQEALERHQVILWDHPTETGKKCIACTSCGRTELDGRVVIADPDTGIRSSPGTVGEIWVAGPHVAQGYWKRNAQTEATFHAYLQDTGEGPFLRTGDLGFLLSGDLFVTGRLKDLIIIEGRNLYPQDIEHVVGKSHPLLRPGYGAAFAVEGAASEELVIVQEVVRHVDEGGLQEAVQAICQAVLWECDVQVAAVELLRAGTILKTSSGKIQRRACRSRFLAGDLEVVYRWKRGEGLSDQLLDEVLKKLWAEILHQQQVGAFDNFFALGGHSLLAMELLSRIRKIVPVEVAPKDLLEAPTPSAFAKLIAHKHVGQSNVDEGETSSLPQVEPDPKHRYEPFPLTDLQQAYWVGRYVEGAMVGIHGYIEVEAIDLDLHRFERALQCLIERHEMLRAVLLPDGQQQILERVPPFQVKILDLRGQDREGQTRRLAQIRHILDHQLLSVEQWPAFEIWVSRLDDRQVRLHLSIESIFVDAWSMKTLIHECIRLYHEPDLVLPPLSLSFRDYVLAEMSLRSSVEYQRSQQYWLGRISSLPPAPLLPLVSETERTWQRPHFVHREATLGKGHWQQLKASARAIGVTPSVVLLTAFALVLARWSKTARFSLNVSTFNRLPLHPSVNEIVGDFTSLSILAVDHTTPASFEKRAKRLQEQLWLDLQSASYSGIQVLRGLTKMHAEGLKALMPIVFTSLLIEDTASPVPPPWGKMLYCVTQTPQVWLDHQVLEVGGELVFHWQSVDAMFPAGLIDDMFATYCQVLQRLSCEEASWSQEHWDLLPEQQRALLVHINETSAPVAEELLHTLFLKQVARRTDQLALITPTHRLTYKQVERGAQQLAKLLRDWGAHPDQLVGVVMEKGWEQVVAILGILQSGAAYLPLDAHLPAERLRYLLEDGQLSVVVTQSWIEKRIEWPKDVKRICADSLDLDKQDVPRLDTVQGPDNLAYVIYTSGSTGLPKGVMIDHRGAVNTILDINRRFSVSSSDRILALSALHFDLSVYDIFGILAAGATIVLPDEQTLRDPGFWLTMIEQERVTIWNTVPALLQLLVEQAEVHASALWERTNTSGQGQATGPLRSLRLALLSGDWMPLSLPGRLKKLSRGTEVISLGGATEASIWSILYSISTIDACRRWSCKTVPYGKPMENQQVLVLSEELEPCPVWVAGDLYIAGIGLARGYWRDEQKTQASFFVHPRTGQRLYRTGDLGRYLPDGNIEFLGREDLQVKVHGHRIELGEIEHTLLQHPEVQATVVTVISEQSDEKRLVAYVTLRPEPLSHKKSNLYEALHVRFGQTSLRKDPGKPVIDLARPTVNADTLRKYRQRLSYRQFLPEPLSFKQLSDFLSPLSRIELSGLPKHLYPSAGSIYPVQTYLSIQPGGVEGLAAGIYYYNPESHQLILLTEGTCLQCDIHAPINQPIFDQAAFSLFLIADLAIISAHYGDAARDFCLLEAGYMGQLLMTMAAEQHVGLCPVGHLDFEQVRAACALAENHLLLHSFIAGRVDPSAATGWSFLPAETEKGATLQLAHAEETGRALPSTPMEQAQRLRRFLDEKLPAYMVPSTIVVLDQLPLTANGKVDRRALPVPDTNSTEVRTVEGAASYAPPAPRTPIEEIVRNIWREVLAHSQVRIHDDFFALGGQSLQIMRIASRVNKLFQVEIPLPRLFQALTIAEMARCVEDALRCRRGSVLCLSEHLSEVLPLVPKQWHEAIPLSFAQQRLWFLSQLQPESAAYMYPLFWRLRGELSTQALEQSLQELVWRHESLRTTFTESMGQPVQVIHPAGGRNLSLPVVDLQRLKQETREGEIARLAEQETQYPCDLTNGPLMRVGLLRLEKQEHMFLFIIHHIVADGWSRDIFKSEMTALYQSKLNGDPSPLAPLPIQYADYTLWQREVLQGPVFQKQLNYWIRQLAEVPMMNLPVNRPRRALQTFVSAQQSLVLSASLLQQLKVLSQQSGVTLFMTLLTAFSILLRYYTGQDDLVIGTDIANRNPVETEQLIGFFVNQLALRIDLSGNPSFLEMLYRVHKISLDAYAHQDLPFERLVEVLNPQRDLSRTPLFQVKLLLQQEPVSSESLFGDLVNEVLEPPFTTPEFDLVLHLLEHNAQLLAHLEYRTDLFEPETIMRLLDNFQTLLERIVQNPQAHLSELPLLTATERNLLLVEWNATGCCQPTGAQCEYSLDRCIHQLVEQQVKQTPDAVALVFEDELLTYQTLNRRANQLAAYLQALGVGPEVLVGICMQRSIEMLVGLLGVLKAGGAYVPLEPTLPAGRLAFLIEDAQVQVILTHDLPDGREAPLARGVRVVHLVTDWQVIAAASQENPQTTVACLNPVYLIYTSGSTGKPKGVINTHQGLCNRLHWMQQAYQLTPQDRVQQKTPLSFDVSFWECFWPLLTGASLIIARPAGHQDPGYLRTLMARQQVTTMHFVPSMLQAFLRDEPTGRERHLQSLHSLRQVICSGEALSVELQASFFAQMGEGVELHNLYGPTEAAIDVTFWRCQRSVEANKQPEYSVPIGRPIANTQVYLLDRDLAPVPIGVTGELYIGGVGLARGYANRPELTAECFVPHPFVPHSSVAAQFIAPGARLYRTGDLARYRNDGEIEYLGRLDQQVKIRGFRIELGEIETILLRHPMVREVVVVTHEDTAGSKQLMAYVVARAGDSPQTEAAFARTLRQYCREQLPDSMVPAFFVRLPALPLSPNGKVDRRALPVPERSTFETSHGQTARTPIEEVVSAIYREVLRVEQFGIDESFFDLGGHSLLVIQVISRIRAAMGIELSVRNLFETPSVAGLTKQIDQQLRAGNERTMPPLVAMTREQDLPLSFAQQRLWFQEQMVSDHSTYVLPLTLRLHGSLQVSVLEQCLREIIRRHESLRTIFMASSGQPIQMIHADAHVPLIMIDLPIGDAEKQLELFYQQPFDLSRVPLMRMALLRLQEQEHLFCIVVHHIIFDAWSASIFFRELSLLYEAFLQGKPSPLPPLTLQYVDVALWQRDWLKGAVLDTLLHYWTRQLARAVPVQMPTDRPRSALLSDRGAIHTFTLPVHLCQQLTALSRETGVTLFMTLLTAFQILLSRTTGQDEIVIGTDSANRTELATENIIGFFVNILALRVKIHGQATFREIVKRVCTTVLAAYAHQELPFERLVDALRLKRDPSQVPLINVLFVLNNVPQPTLVLPGLTVSTVESKIHTTKFDVALFLMETDQILSGYVNYRTDLFDARTIMSLVDHFEVLLHSIVTAPDNPVETLEMFTEQEREQAVEEERVLQEMNNRTLKAARRHIMNLAPKS